MAEIHERFCCLYAAQADGSRSPVDHTEDCRNFALKDSKGNVIRCMHDRCYRNAVRIVSFEKPKHAQFQGQCHDCCGVHSRA